MLIQPLCACLERHSFLPEIVQFVYFCHFNILNEHILRLGSHVRRWTSHLGRLVVRLVVSVVLWHRSPSRHCCSYSVLRRPCHHYNIPHCLTSSAPDIDTTTCGKDGKKEHTCEYASEQFSIKRTAVVFTAAARANLCCLNSKPVFICTFPPAQTRWKKHTYPCEN